MPCPPLKAKAIALKELQTAQNELTVAQNDLENRLIGLEAARNRLRSLGRTDKEIGAFLIPAKCPCCQAGPRSPRPPMSFVTKWNQKE